MEMEPVSHPGDHHGARRSGAGFSLIEVMIAALLLLIIVLALLPLFALSLSNNLAGREYSVATQHGRSQIELYTQLPLDRPALGVDAGATAGVLRELFDRARGEFSTGSPSLPPTWSRVTTVRQYNVRDLYDDGRLTNPLPGGSPPEQVHLWEIVVEVESEREAGGGLGSGRRVTLSTVRGF